MGMIGSIYALEDDEFLRIDLEEIELEALSGFSESTDVDKAWQAIAIVATGVDALTVGTADPLDPVLGGSEFGDDWGYGPPRHLTPSEVQAVASHLSALDDGVARQRFDSMVVGVEAVYPWFGDATIDANEEWHKYVLPGLNDLRGIYQRAAQAGHWIVLTLE